MSGYKIEHMDPEWAYFAKCPECRTVTHGCCATHVEIAMDAHLTENHEEER